HRRLRPFRHRPDTSVTSAAPSKRFVCCSGVSDPARVHRYTVSSRWRGSTGAGYDAYDRSHEVEAAPAGVTLALSSDPAFRGDATLLNPEQLLVMAASSCQLLSFLAVAARARIDVIEYRDDAEGEMPEDDPPVRITRIT